jgi:CubicO group peptidase (beta-lactamase class C family)
LTKPLTATGIMLLAERGKIDLDESIEEYISPLTLKSYAYDSKKVTVRHLLHYTSGLPTHLNYFYEDSYPEDLDMNLYDGAFVSEQYDYQVKEAAKAYRLVRLVRAFIKHAYARWLDARTRLKQGKQPQVKRSPEHKLHTQH